VNREVYVRVVGAVRLWVVRRNAVVPSQGRIRMPRRRGARFGIGRNNVERRRRIRAEDQKEEGQ